MTPLLLRVKNNQSDRRGREEKNPHLFFLGHSICTISSFPQIVWNKYRINYRFFPPPLLLKKITAVCVFFPSELMER